MLERCVIKRLRFNSANSAFDLLALGESWELLGSVMLRVRNFFGTAFPFFVEAFETRDDWLNVVDSVTMSSKSDRLYTDTLEDP